jgi:hypothetical protein
VTDVVEHDVGCLEGDPVQCERKSSGFEVELSTDVVEQGELDEDPHVWMLALFVGIDKLIVYCAIVIERRHILDEFGVCVTRAVRLVTDLNRVSS